MNRRYTIIWLDTSEEDCPHRSTVVQAEKVAEARLAFASEMSAMGRPEALADWHIIATLKGDYTLEATGLQDTASTSPGLSISGAMERLKTAGWPVHDGRGPG